MTNPTVRRGFLSNRPRRLYIAAAVIVSLALSIWLFFFIGAGGYTWRHEVSVVEAELRSPDRLTLIVASCNKNPKVSMLRETEIDVQVRVKSDSHPFLLGGQDCLDAVEVQLQQPLEGRSIFDRHSGRPVSVIGVIPYTVTDAQPAADWQLVLAPSGSSPARFSLRLPPGWELNEFQGINPYRGEVVGEGARLTYAFGGLSWSRSPSNDREHTYGMDYEDIGGFTAQLLISMDPGAGYTAAFFHGEDDANLHLVGEDLTPEQQWFAVAMFRSVRLLDQSKDGS